MDTSLEIVIYENPIPKARSRTYMRGTRACTFDPQHEKKRNTQLLMRQALKDRNENMHKSRKHKDTDDLFNDSISVHLRFFYKIPCSTSDHDRSLINWGVITHHSCDIDNCIKYTLDCANEILWADDRYITHITASKEYDDTPRTEISIKRCDMIINEQQKKILSVFNRDDIKNIFSFLKKFEDLFDITYLDDKQYYSNDELIYAANVIMHLSEYADKFKKIQKIIDKKKKDND